MATQLNQRVLDWMLSATVKVVENGVGRKDGFCSVLAMLVNHCDRESVKLAVAALLSGSPIKLGRDAESPVVELLSHPEESPEASADTVVGVLRRLDTKQDWRTSQPMTMASSATARAISSARAFVAGRRPYRDMASLTEG